MNEERSRYAVECADGWRLDVLKIPANGARRGVAVLGHAMMVDRRSMDRPEGRGFASVLAEHGWEVHLADLRGRGDSGPTARDGGSWTYDDIIRLDLPALVAEVRRRADGAFLWVVGHSLAGHASIATAGSGRYEAAPEGHVLLSVNMWTSALEPSWLRRRKKGLAVLILAVVVRVLGYFPARRLGLGPVDEAGAYIADLVRIWRDRRWGSADGLDDYLATMPSVRGPILNVIGKADSLMAHSVGARNWTDGFGPGRATFELVGAGDHGLDFDPDHMSVVTEPAARPLWDWIAGWMARAAEGSDPSAE